MSLALQASVFQKKRECVKNDPLVFVMSFKKREYVKNEDLSC